MYPSNPVRPLSYDERREDSMAAVGRKQPGSGAEGPSLDSYLGGTFFW
jgi:hypothetical protein